MSKNFQEIYNKSIENPEEFWRNNSEDIFGSKNQLKF